ncbi:MAG: acyclic terpene utilization AtuA family protein [Alphaproteobacteria bacterium]|nr:acyclic terpene utilization AtuA family protein [Alphaproteobacteria bacterium]
MVKVLIPSGALGISVDPDALERGLQMQPDIIAIDGGSTDSGPHYLGTGTCKYSRASVKREWRLLMLARARLGVPLLIGTAGTCGTDSMVDWLLDITREIAAEEGQSLRVAALYCSQDTGAVAQSFAGGAVSALPGAPEISAKTITDCSNIVALAGAEQIRAALATGAEIVIAGRSTDTAVIAALPLARGCHPGGAWHGAKIGECGALATNNPASGSILIEFDDEGFTVQPTGEGVLATPTTVFAHMLYENTDPFILYEPGGHLDVTEATYQPVNGNSVRVQGSVWNPDARYTVKLEGAQMAGYQTASLVLVRDRRYVGAITQWIQQLQATFEQREGDNISGDYTLEFRLIGANATLGGLETQAEGAHEIGVLSIITAPTQQSANDIAKLLNPYLLHYALTPNEPMPTFAFPFSPPEMDRGALHEFVLNHVLELADPMDAFRLEVKEIGA